MTYKDAGNKLQTALEAKAPDKYYPRVSVDLKKFSGNPDLDEKIDLRGRVCGINKHDDGGSVEIEVTEICVPENKDGVDEPKNEADRELAKLQKR